MILDPRPDLGPNVLQRARAHETPNMATGHEFLHALVFRGADAFLCIEDLFLGCDIVRLRSAIALRRLSTSISAEDVPATAGCGSKIGQRSVAVEDSGSDAI